MTSLPVLTVEVAWPNQPGDTTLTWTDITAYVDLPGGIAVTAGRADELGVVPPSRLNMRLDNTDGRFTPGNASSPYYPHVVARKRIRLTATKPGAGTSYRFTGFVRDWPVRWPTGGQEYAVVEVSAFDRLEMLGREDVRSPLSEELLRDDPVCYYPLTEPTGSTSAGDISPNRQPALSTLAFGSGAELSFGAGTGPATDSSPATMFRRIASESDYQTFAAQWLAGSLATPIVGTSGYTVHVAVRVEPTVGETGAPTPFQRHVIWSLMGAGTMNALGYSAATPCTAMAELDPVNPLYPYTSRGASSPVTLTATRSVVFTLDPSLIGRTYVDGVLVRQDIAAYVSPYPLRSVWLGQEPYRTDGLTGTLSHFAVFEGVASTDRIQAWADATADGFAGERSGERIGRVLDWVGVPTGERNLEAGDLIVGHTDTAGSTVAAVLGMLGDAEPGRVFCDGQGRVSFHARRRGLNRDAALALTADDVAGDIEWDGDPDRIVNDVTASRPLGATVRAVDQASKDAYGTYATSVTVPAETDDLLGYHVDWLARRSSTPEQRIRTVTLDLLTLPDATVASILDLQIGDILTISGMPSQSPQSTVAMTIEGWTETISPAEWTIVLNTSPADMTRYVELDDATYGVIGSYVLADY